MRYRNDTASTRCVIETIRFEQDTFSQQHDFKAMHFPKAPLRKSLIETMRFWYLSVQTVGERASKKYAFSKRKRIRIQCSAQSMHLNIHSYRSILGF